MARQMWILVAICVLAMLAVPAAAMKKGTFQYGDYTITVVPYSSANPGHGGSITIVGENDLATVYLEGEYTTTARPAPVLSVELAGTIETPEGVNEVYRLWVFEPRETHMVWKVVVAWIDSLIAS